MATSWIVQFIEWVQGGQLEAKDWAPFAIASVVVILALRRRARSLPTDASQLRLRIPASGILPLGWVGLYFGINTWLSGLPVSSLIPADGRYLAMLLLVPLCTVLASLLNRPERVAAVWSRVAGAPPFIDMKSRVGKQLPWAIATSIAFLSALIWFGGYAADEAQRTFYLGYVIVPAVAMDLFSEFSARARQPLVSAWPEHRVYAVDAALMTCPLQGSLYFRARSITGL